MKKKVLIIFKYPHEWNLGVIDKFSNYYDTEFLYISNFKNRNFTEIVNDINNLIKSKNIEIVVFDVDYFKFINFFFIKKINSKKKIFITGDDFEFHEFHSVTASACDLVLSHCPFSVLKYKEKGYEAYRMHLENDGNLFKNYNLKKEIDVLFFGRINPDRKVLLNFITSCIILLHFLFFSLGYRIFFFQFVSCFTSRRTRQQVVDLGTLRRKRRFWLNLSLHENVYNCHLVS